MSYTHFEEIKKLKTIIVAEGAADEQRLSFGFCFINLIPVPFTHLASCQEMLRDQLRSGKWSRSANTAICSFVPRKLSDLHEKCGDPRTPPLRPVVATLHACVDGGREKERERRLAMRQIQTRRET